MTLETTRRVDMPMETREAPITGVNADNRTVDLVWTTGAPVKRYSFMRDGAFNEVLDVSETAVDMSRLNSGAPLLDSHGAYSLSGQLGVVERAWIADGKGHATVRFAKAEDNPRADQILRQVKDKIIRNVSVGYRVNEFRVERGDGKTTLDTYRAVNWTPMEISLVTVPADAGAGTRSQTPVHACIIMETRMNEITPGAAGSAILNPAVIDEASIRAAAREEGARMECTRQSEIRIRTAAVRLPDEVATRLINENIPLERIAESLTDEIAKRAPAAPPARIAVTVDETQTRREAIEEAVLHRAFPSAVKLDKGREWRGMRLMDIGRDILVGNGEKVRGLAPMELAQRAITTSDLANVLANVANKSLQLGYTAEQRTFLPFCTQHDPVDFKQVSSIVLSEGSNLELVDEHGEFRRGSVSDSAEKWNLKTYGKIIGFTRQAMLNDDLSALTRIPQQFGIAGVRLENDQVWGVITANAALADTVALFHATHKNLQTGGGSALAVSSLATAREGLRTQKGPDGNQTLNLVMRYVMVPAALETTLEQIMSPLLFAAQTSNTVPQFYRGLTPIVEPRLDANSLTAWYGACDPGQYATIEYGYLQGQDGVYLETQIGFEVDGMRIKVRHDFGCKAVNFRGLAKSAGA